MAYSKQTWTDNVSVADSVTMGHIEDGIEAAAATADTVAADLVTTQEVTPTIEELFTSVRIERTISTTASENLWVAPFPLRIVQASLVSDVPVAQSTTNVWNIFLRKTNFGGEGGAFQAFNIVGKTNNSGGVISGDKDWNYDGLTFDPVNSVFNKGDLLQALFLVQSGTPTAFDGLVWTIRYEPI